MGNTSKIYEKLAAVQMEYAAPKDNFNAFGGYAYRSFETMLDTLKPLLHKHGLVLTTTNELQECGGHVYVKSVCILTDTETGEQISSDSFAREDDARKGMVGAQITGGCVSYSAKYALGLLLSVGTGQRDADSMDNRPQTQNSRPQPPQTRPTPPPQQPMQAPQYQAQQAPPMQYQAQQAPPMQYTAPPMPPQQTAPQYQAQPMPPQQPVTAPPVQQAPPMAQPPMQTPPQPQFSADGVKPQAPISADAPTPPFTRKPRPARPADGSAPVAPHLTPSALPASWGINESTAIADENEPQMAENSGWMAIPDGVNETELPFA